MLLDFVWWFILLTFGVLFKSYFHTDPYLPAIILFLQKNKYLSGLLYGLLCILILEGYTDLPFGSILLYYMSLISFYFFLKEFFKPESIFFIILLSFIFFPIYYLSITTIANLSDLYIDPYFIYSISFKNFISFPLLWWIYSYFYNKYFFKRTEIDLV